MKKFKNEYLSYSRLKRYEQCPLSFKLIYIDKVPKDPSDALLFGSLIHTVLEKVYRWVIEEEYSGPIPENLIMDLYKDHWAQSGLSTFSLFQEGVEILRAYIHDNAIVDHRDILAVEKQFTLSIRDYGLLGYIDRVDRINDDTIEIVDYKTNRLIFTRDEVDADLQLSVYNMAARELWPWAKNVHLVFHLLRHSVRMHTERTQEQLDAARDYVLTLGKRTENATDYPPRLNHNCQYCDVRMRCSEYQQAIAGQIDMQKSDKNDLESVAKERERVARLAKILYARKEELERILKKHLEDRDTLELAGMQYRMTHSTKLSYPIAPTLKILSQYAGIEEAEAREKLMVLDKSRIDAFVKDLKKSMPSAAHRVLKAELETIADKDFTPRFYAKEIQ